MMSGFLKSIKSDFERVAHLYSQQLCHLFEFGEQYGWWVGDEIGGVYCNGDTFMISFAEMRIVVDNQMKYEDYLEYLDYCDWAMRFDQVAPNLQAWLNGCPRYDKETMQHLRDLKREYDSAMYAFQQAKKKL